MTEAELRQLVEQIVAALLKQAPGAVAPKLPRVVVLLDGAEAGHERAIMLLRELAPKADLRALPSPAYLERFGSAPAIDALGCPDRLLANANLTAREKEVDAAKAVLLLQPQRATLGRAARGLSLAGAPSGLLVRALANAIPTFSGGGETDPSSWPASMPGPMRHGRGSIGDRLARDLETLASWHLVHRLEPLELKAPLLAAVSGSPTAAPAAAPSLTAANAPQQPAPGKRTFITADDIRRIHSEGKRELRLSPADVLTDAARELASVLHVAVEGPGA